VATVLTGAALLFWARVGVGMLAAGLSITLAGLALSVNSAWLTALDTAVEVWLLEHRSPGLRSVVADIFRLIGHPVLFAAAVLACGSVLARRARSMIPLLVLVGAVATGVVLEHLLKATVGRTAATVAGMQDPAMQKYSKVVISFLHSFPSGHVTGTVAFLGLIAVCAGSGRSVLAQAKLAGEAAAGVGFVALLALYSRAHTLTDVVGGLVLGGAIVAVGAVVLGRMLPTGPVSQARPVRRSAVVPLPEESGRIPVG